MGCEPGWEAFCQALAAGRYFEAHEALEPVWRAHRDLEAQTAIWWAVLLWHWRRGNLLGARRMWEKICARRDPTGDWAQAVGAALTAGRPWEPAVGWAVWRGLCQSGGLASEGTAVGGIIREKRFRLEGGGGMRVVVARPLDAAVMRQMLERPGVTVEVFEGPGPMTREELVRRLESAEVLVSMLTERIDEDLLRAAPALRLVANVAVGFDNFDLAAMTRHRVLATNTPDVLTEATADLAYGLMLALVRGFVRASQAMREGAWRGWSPTAFLGHDLEGLVLGILGFGRIGQAVARRALASRMQVWAVPPRHGGGDPPPGVRWVSREELVAGADVVSLHVPATPQTYHLCDDAFFASMKPGAWLVNTARGSVVDTAALLRALDSGRLAGAALDVFEEEPLPVDHPLYRYPQVLLTPHIGSATVETRRRMAQRAWDNVVDFLEGRPPRDLLNPEAW
ncbi:MAG: DUF309 domain-containing protein [Firmicutes bacterium]|nr:DUF309 domain-containing protein [Alicyclobacillaceae bacterium]MCL6497612.1 DUF309 domain-containing protein [Bacillota bacterium]